ncbi:uncharacterized protein CANTADRAFT_44037 [Suhomyces tanzawaensis NRRL Y-17324]|uniref:Uncharacterized protein n=1 Tax=Suhomyces tanzawaensis NRRL Y-17324 TaxID=984487 RepID=A0A1E4SRN6_9ASCO|nr:uncharacterized protein CANTADRAFT_44037 [Suhomyces tanzawaensis NRRL Y-17324]ODV82176.1 hypothetical protein CANTADRAFT_44037 [Suhomyces tanzawaensis NRRL Y-17324]
MALLKPIALQVRFNSSAQSPEPVQIPKPQTNDSTGAKPKAQSLWKDILRLLRLARPEYKLLFYALMCLIATSATSMLVPLFIGKIIDTTKDDDDDTSDRRIMGLAPVQFYSSMCVLFGLGALANFGRTYLLRTVGERFVARLRSRLFLKILSQDSYFFDVGPTKTGMKTGDLISRLSSDTQVISKTLSGNVSDGARSLISGLVGLSMMCFVSWKLTLCMSLLFPPLIVMSSVYGRKIKVLSRQVQENLGLMTKVTEEKLNGLKTIQSFAKQRSVVHDYNHEIKKIFDTSLREGKLSGIYYGINGLLGNVSMIGLLIVGTQLIGNGELTIGELSSFMMYAIYTGSSVFGLGNFYTELMKGIGAAERIFELIELKPSIATSIGKKVDNIYGDIKFKNIKFNYPSRKDSVIFRDLNLTIKLDENVCFVGPSGSGKSTILQLLLRFYDPLQGEVTINDHNIKDLNLNYYRSKLGYVQQEPFLFSGTIRENLVFGKEDATEEEIEEALRLSNSQGFIDALPDGIDTVIGPSNSTQLSGGQKQRISLARTLICKPKVLLLDEATSALDSISEEIVMRNLNRLNREQGVAIISIAHRLSTIKNSDRIVVLDSAGEVLEDGSFTALYNNSNSALNKLLKNHNLE